MNRTCSCGAALPSDKRVKRCATCAGRASRDQDNARHARAAAKLVAIDWAMVGIVARMRLEEIRRNDASVQKLVEQIAAREGALEQATIGRAVRGCVLRPHELKRVLAWLGRPAEDFETTPARDAARAQLAKGRAA